MLVSEQEVSNWINSNSKTILFFKTSGCGVCTAQLPKVENLAQQYGFKVLAINLSENMELAASQLVLNVPLTKVFVNGKEVFKEGAYLRFNQLEQCLSAYNN